MGCLDQCRQGRDKCPTPLQCSGGTYWPLLMADRAPEPSEADDAALYTWDSLLPAWLLWVGVGLSVAFLAYVAAMAS